MKIRWKLETAIVCGSSDGSGAVESDKYVYFLPIGYISFVAKAK